ncbi:MAG: ATP phosphoribosyltransferase, partial [Bacillota bacterium]|nr:ATP phosphoribosyltransferase [Bacillota bacterium]
GLLSPGAPPLDEEARRLVYRDEQTGWRFLLVKPADVPTYVEYGGADLGVVGKDVLLEVERDVCELVDLGLGFCRMVVAVPAATEIESVDQLGFNTRVATKFPRIAAQYFRRRGIQAEIVELHGSIELAPLVGMAEAIVDLTATGQTLSENGLRVVDELFQATARLVANRVSYKVAYEQIMDLVARLREVVGY